MKTLEEIKACHNLDIIDCNELDGNLRIHANYFDPVELKRYLVVFTNGLGWEHMSVSQPHRTPTWEIMCRLKDIFWSEDEVCVEYHPRKEDYVNMHEHCLHIWKPVGVELPTPPSIMVGFKGVNSTQTREIARILVNSMSKEEILNTPTGKKISNRKVRRTIK